MKELNEERAQAKREAERQVLDKLREKMEKIKAEKERHQVHFDGKQIQYFCLFGLNMKLCVL